MIRLLTSGNLFVLPVRVLMLQSLVMQQILRLTVAFPFAGICHKNKDCMGYCSKAHEGILRSYLVVLGLNEQNNDFSM